MHLDMQDVLNAYNLEDPYPEIWSEPEHFEQFDIRDGSIVGDMSKRTLINHFMALTHTKPNYPVVFDEMDPLGLKGSVNNVLKTRGIDVDNDPAQHALYMLSSTKFNSKLFLRNVHSSTSLEDLQRGLLHLKRSIAGQNADLRGLVGTDYEHFVNAKRQLDEVMQRLEDTGVDAENQYGFGTLRQTLDEITSKYTLCSRPLDDFTLKRRRMQNALQMLESHRILFNVPKTLEKHIESEHHEDFVRELNRGWDLVDEFCQSTNRDRQQIGDTLAKYISAIRDKYKSNLWKKIMSTTDTDYTHLFNRIVDLGIDKNPAVEWMEMQIRQIYHNINELFDRLKLTTALINVQIDESYKKRDLASYLKCVSDRSLGTELNGVVDAVEVTEAWLSQVERFTELQTIMDGACSFWNECVQLLQGRKLSPNLRINAQQAQNISGKCTGIAELVAKKLIEYLHTPSSKTLRLTSGQNSSKTKDAMFLIPPNSNSFSAAKYFAEILDIIELLNFSVTRLMGPSNPIGKAMPIVRNEFLKEICSCWTDDAILFGDVQCWKNEDLPELKRLPEYYSRYHGLFIRQLTYISGIGRKGGENELKSEILDEMSESFTCALTYSLKSMFSALVESEKKLQTSELKPHPLSLDIKVLVTLANLHSIKSDKLPHLMRSFETSFRYNISNVQTNVSSVLEYLSSNLFGLYARKKKSKISMIVTQELARLAPIWATDGMPKEISRYVFELLMIFVEVHAKFKDYCPYMIGYALDTLHHHVLDVLLQGIRQMDKFGKLGTLQAVADIEVIRSCLYALRTEASNRKIQLLYDTIRGATLDQNLWLVGPDAPRGHVRDIIERTLRQEFFSYTCFKTVTVGSKDDSI